MNTVLTLAQMEDSSGGIHLTGIKNMTLTPEWATIVVTILIAILGSVLGQLKASWDMRSDLRVGITKIEALERKVDDHEERLRDVEKGKKL